MSILSLESYQDLAILTMNNGITNAISPAVVENFAKTLHEVRKVARGLVVCGGSKFFSIGFDLPALLLLNKEDMADFWYGFNNLMLDLLTISMPTACAISGHAIAGGNILALAFDYRLATDSAKKMGLNEIKLGIPVPYLADMLLRQIIGEKMAKNMIYGGELISLSEAEHVGLIDEIVPENILKQYTIEKIAACASYQPEAFAAVKSNRVEDVATRYKKNFKQKNEIFLHCWFNDQTQALLQEAAKKF